MSGCRRSERTRRSSEEPENSAGPRHRAEYSDQSPNLDGCRPSNEYTVSMHGYSNSQPVYIVRSHYIRIRSEPCRWKHFWTLVLYGLIGVYKNRYGTTYSTVWGFALETVWKVVRQAGHSRAIVWRLFQMLAILTYWVLDWSSCLN